ncbi:MAG TPA: protein tyrosine kinase, partial [Gemmatimonadota bacterium]|nr:protein tyrosine kinase [Gemmatimonadota bacterium]
IEDSIRRTDVPGLAFLPHGKLTGFDPVLLEGDRLVRTLEDLRKLYDVVVIDAPPLVAGTDPLILGELADQVVIVLRTGETDMQVTRARLEGMGSFDLPLAGLVLNDVPDRKLYQKYYSSYQYYVEGEVVA